MAARRFFGARSKARRELPPGDSAWDWAREDYTRSLLGAVFDLRFESGRWVINAESAEALWELLSSSTPPLRRWLDGLEPARWVEAEATYLEFLAGGTLSRDDVLVAGVRR